MVESSLRFPKTLHTNPVEENKHLTEEINLIIMPHDLDDSLTRSSLCEGYYSVTTKINKKQPKKGF